MARKPISSLDSLIAAFSDPDNTLSEIYFKTIGGVTVTWASQPLETDTTTYAIDGNQVNYSGQRYYDAAAFADGTYLRFYQYGALFPPVLIEDNATSYPPALSAVLSGTVSVVITDGTNDVASTFEAYREGIPTPPAGQLSNLTAPTITGGTTAGDVLTYNQDDTWDFTGTLVRTVQWLRSTNGGAWYSPISGATANTYTTVSPADEGALIKVEIHATDDNSPPAAEVRSNAIQIAAAGNVTLSNTGLPLITGSPVVGQTLSVTAGTWVGDTPITLTYQWNRDGSPISGATSSTYVLQGADDGALITVTETATEGGGDTESDTATSSSVLVTTSGTYSHDYFKQLVLAEFATSSDKGWAGFTSETGFTIYTETTVDGVYNRMRAWAGGNPATDLVKIICDWDGISNHTSKLGGMVKAAKLTAGSDWKGYQLPTGGVWLEAASGKRPVIGTLVDFVGMTRLHVNGVHFAGQMPASPTAGQLNTTNCVQFRATATYPMTGCIYMENHTIGQKDNRVSYTYANAAHGIDVQQAYSFRHKNVRAAGVRTAFGHSAQYIWREFTDAEEWTGDFRHTYGQNIGSGNTVWVYDNMAMCRNDWTSAVGTGFHVDFHQFGTQNNQPAGYTWCFENQLGHIKADTTASGTQGFYNDDSPAPTKYEGTIKNVALGMTAYHAYVGYDPSKAGRRWVENAHFFRGGNTYYDASKPANYEPGCWFNPIHDGPLMHFKNCTITRMKTNPGPHTKEGIRYVNAHSGWVSGDGSTEANAMRIEDAIAGFANITRTTQNGVADYMQYTIPNETAAAATAWQAIQDFYEPRGSTWAAFGITWPAWTEPAVYS